MPAPAVPASSMPASSMPAFLPPCPLVAPAPPSLQPAARRAPHILPRRLAAAHLPSPPSAASSPLPPRPVAPTENNSAPATSTPTPAWAGLGRLVRISALSVAMLLSGSASPRRLQPDALRLSPPSVMATAVGARGDTTAAAPNDVEAAAMTLGAVTVGGLLMRAIVASRRDEAADSARLQEDCARLQREEQERALRVQRRKMEAVEGDAPVIPDDDLMSDFMKRVQSLERNDGDEDDSDKDSDDDGTARNDPAMRHTPIPDRATGSAVLDRPPETPASSGPGEGEKGDADADENAAKPDELEMLNRMWNMSTDADGKSKDAGSGPAKQ